MSTMITFPTTLFTKVELTLQRAGQAFRARLTGKRQTLSWPFALWTAECTFIEYDQFKKNDVLSLRAFQVELEGQVNIFRLPLVDGQSPSTGYIGPEGVVAGAGQVGRVVNTSGWSNSTLLLKRGDWISINDELKMVMQDVTSSGSGTATISFLPALRRAPPNSSVTKVRNVTVLMSASKDDAASWAVTYPLTHTFKPLQCIEVFE